MKQVIRYQCEFCKKEFKTPDRHYCKKNPELKNCFTCKHLDGWAEGRYWGENGYDPPAPYCKAEPDHDWDIETIKSCNYNMQCERWEAKESEGG